MTIAESYFQTIDPDYEIATLVRFRDTTSSACGEIRLAAYCPATVKQYIDEVAITAFNDSSDIRSFYVTWHETAHHYQDIVLNQMFDYGTTNEASRQVELSADCWVGAIAKFANASEAQIQQALQLSIRLGGSADGTHGSGQQRAAAVSSGYNGVNCITYGFDNA